MNLIVTGAVGFVGFHFCKKMCQLGYNVIGVDNINSYYSTKVKKLRLSILKKEENFKFHKIDVNQINKKKFNEKISYIFHFAATPGVRYSIENPKLYVKNNILGFQNICELSKKLKVRKLFYASSSSVYGDTKIFPSHEKLALSPNSIYALTKLNNEQLAKQYYRHYKLNSVGLRFFTIFGELGRPDMFLYKYVKASEKNLTFNLNYSGNYIRDFTYVHDAIDQILKILKLKKKGSDVFNICSSHPQNLKKIIYLCDKIIKRPKIKTIKFKNQLDSLKTHGSNKKLRNLIKKNLIVTNLFKAITNSIISFKKYKKYYI